MPQGTIRSFWFVLAMRIITADLRNILMYFDDASGLDKMLHTHVVTLTPFSHGSDMTGSIFHPVNPEWAQPRLIFYATPSPRTVYNLMRTHFVP